LGFKTMMKIVFKLLLSSVLIAAIFADEFDSRTKGANYDGYKLIRTNLLHNNQAIELQTWEEDLDFWKSAKSGFSADILVEPGQIETLANQLKIHDIGFNEIIPNLGDLIKSQEKNLIQDRNGTERSLSFDSYYSHSELNNYIDTLASKFGYVNSVTVGQTYEGRDMKILQISRAGSGAPNIFIEAGIHAREWISPAMATYLIDSLLYNDVDGFTKKMNFHFIINANPDGYEYSRNTDRLWRKTRSDHGSSCKGVDGNRNWGFHWGGTGSSGNQCSNIYRGPQEFSEIEFQNIRDYVLALDPVPILAESIHSYSQLWLWPYGYDYSINYPDNYEEIRDLADDAVKALKEVHGKEFEPMNSGDFYPAAGASDDWYKGVLNARFVYTVELRDTGYHGFVLPPDQIKPSGEEFWAAQRVIFQKMVDLSTSIACKDKQKVKKCKKLKKKGKCTKKRVWKKCKKTCNKC